MTIALFAESMW